ncbi:MAG: SDR family NAD(P)-dependent oxidoreductase [Gammaproteobacteria bacterium]|nr:SDR family NAD(P)-dependent oxidoreductase [Gammaproteobacteria bacterium]
MSAPTAGSMTGRICLVTGATSGIGFESARALVAAGAEVWLHGRDADRARAQAQLIAAATGRPAPASIAADFARPAEVRRLGAELSARLPRLDVLLHNAAVLAPRAARTPEGYELTFAVNHLAPFILTQRLLPLLLRAPAARIVIVASRAHRRGRPPAFPPLPQGGDCGAFAAYARSKLCNLLFMRALAARLATSAVTVNAVHPGVVNTGLFRSLPLARAAGSLLLRRLLLSPEEGARASVYLASSPQLTGVSGAYFEGGRPVTPSRAAREEGTAARLWSESERLSAASASAGE